MNQVVLMGRLTKDPETRYTEGNQPLAISRYTLAVDRRTKDKQTDFIPCVAFGHNAEFADKYFKQGMRVLVSGRIQTGSYTNRNGDKVNTTEIVLDSQEFADSKGEKPKKESVDDFMYIPDGVEDDGLPFN